MKFPEQFRVTKSAHLLPGMLTQPGTPFGVFIIPAQKIPNGKSRVLNVIATDGSDGDPGTPEADWEHVSVSICKSTSTPNWAEMTFIKDLFWPPDQCVVQFHPPHSNYVNNHPGCLHLWRHKSSPFPQPPIICV